MPFVTVNFPLTIAFGVGLFVSVYFYSLLKTPDKFKQYNADKSSHNDEIGPLEVIKEFWAGKMPREFQDILDFVEFPEVFEANGSSMPRGILLVGEPGTGKTYFGKMLSKYLNSHFFYACASQMDEIYVGSGPKKIRHLFERASKLSKGESVSNYFECDDHELADVQSMEIPVDTSCQKIGKKKNGSIIFLDEIDAFGNRDTSYFNDSRHSTLNQLLSSMEGIREYKGILVIGATNTPDSVDQALKRTGRFDRTIVMSLPDSKNRYAMLKFHLEKSLSQTNTKLEDHIEAIEQVAAHTSGFSCSDLSTLVNETGLLRSRFQVDAIRSGKMHVSADFTHSFLKAYLFVHNKVWNERSKQNITKYKHDSDRLMKTPDEAYLFVYEFLSKRGVSINENTPHQLLDYNFE